MPQIALIDVQSHFKDMSCEYNFIGGGKHGAVPFILLVMRSDCRAFDSQQNKPYHKGVAYTGNTICRGW